MVEYNSKLFKYQHFAEILDRITFVRTPFKKSFARLIKHVPPPILDYYVNNVPTQDELRRYNLNPTPETPLLWPEVARGRFNPVFVSFMERVEADCIRHWKSLVENEFPERTDDLYDFIRILTPIIGAELNLRYTGRAAIRNGYMGIEERPTEHYSVHSYNLREFNLPNPENIFNSIRTLRTNQRPPTIVQEVIDRARHQGQLAMGLYRDMIKRKGPVFVKIPADWRSFDSNEITAKRLAIEKMLGDVIINGREGSLESFEDDWLIRIELPRVKIMEDHRGTTFGVSDNNPIIRKLSDIQNPSVQDFIEEYAYGPPDDEHYFDNRYFTYVRETFGGETFPLILVYAKNVMNFRPRNTSEPLGAGAARRTKKGEEKSTSLLKQLFQNYTFENLTTCIKNLNEQHKLTIPKIDMIFGSQKHCMIRSILASGFMHNPGFRSITNFKKEIRSNFNALQMEAKRKNLNINNLSPDELAIVISKLTNIPRPTKIITLSDRGTGEFFKKEYIIDGAMATNFGGYVAYMWLMEGESHAIPLIPFGHKYACTQDAWQKACEPPSYVPNDLITAIGDKRADIQLTFDYETLNASREEPAPMEILYRGDQTCEGAQMETLKKEDIMDYMISYCWRKGNARNNPDDWKADYFFREEFKSPTEWFIEELSKLINDLPAICGNKRYYRIDCWAHNLPFDASILLRDYFTWHAQGSFQRLDQNWGVPDASIRDNRFIYIKIPVQIGERKTGYMVNLVLKDSYNILSQPLKGLCASMNVPKKYTKGELDHTLFRTMDDVFARQDEIVKYSLNDVISLLYVLGVFEEKIDNSFLTQSPPAVLNLISEWAEDSLKQLEDDPISMNFEEKKLHGKLQLLQKDIENNQLKNHIALSVYTAAGLTRSIMKIRIFDKLFEGKIALTQEHDQIFRKAYKGGRVQCFELGQISGKINYEDATSLYPSVMLEKLIIGQPTQVEPSAFGPDEHGFAKVNYWIETNSFAYQLPLLCDHVPRRGLVTFRPTSSNPECGTFTSDELKIAEQHGYHFEYLDKWVFKAEAWLKQLTEDLYKLKVDAENSHNVPMRSISKIILNSLYGFWALKPGRNEIKIEVVDPELMFAMGSNPKDIANKHERLLSRIWKQSFGQKMNRIVPIGKSYVLTETSSDGIANFQNVAIAAWITALARIQLWKMMKAVKMSGKRLLYCDTDSVIFQGEIDKNLLDHWLYEGIKLFKCNSETNDLGCITNEFDGDMHPEVPVWKDYADHCAILGLKQYCLWVDDHKKYKIALKGIPQSRKFMGRTIDRDHINFIGHQGKGEMKIGPDDFEVIASGNVRGLNVLFDGFVTGVSNLFSQPYMVLQEPSNIPIRDFANQCKHFGLSYTENTRRCKVGYQKGPAIAPDGTTVPTVDGVLDNNSVRDILRSGKTIKIGYYKHRSEMP